MFTLYAYVTGTREGNQSDKLDKPDKGLQPLSEPSDGGGGGVPPSEFLVFRHLIF